MEVTAVRLLVCSINSFKIIAYRMDSKSKSRIDQQKQKTSSCRILTMRPPWSLWWPSSSRCALKWIMTIPLSVFFFSFFLSWYIFIECGFPALHVSHLNTWRNPYYKSSLRVVIYRDKRGRSPQCVRVSMFFTSKSKGFLTTINLQLQMPFQSPTIYQKLLWESLSNLLWISLLRGEAKGAIFMSFNSFFFR